MSDNRRRIAALRAKAASTTFPAEAAILRAKADELEGKQPPPRQPVEDSVADWVRLNETVFQTGSSSGSFIVSGNFFEQMGGIRVNFNTVPRTEKGQRVQVTNMQGDTYWITVE